MPSMIKKMILPTQTIPKTSKVVLITWCAMPPGLLRLKAGSLHMIKPKIKSSGSMMTTKQKNASL